MRSGGGGDGGGKVAAEEEGVGEAEASGGVGFEKGDD